MPGMLRFPAIMVFPFIIPNPKKSVGLLFNLFGLIIPNRVISNIPVKFLFS